MTVRVLTLNGSNGHGQNGHGHLLDNLSCVQIIPFAPAGGRAHFSQMDQSSRPGQEKPPTTT